MTTPSTRRGLIVTASGGVARIEVDGLDDMQAVVGGLIEPVEGLSAGAGFDIYVNEEGLNFDLPMNALASSLTRYGTPLVGDAFLLGEIDEHGDTTDLPTSVFAFVFGLARAARR